MNIFGEVDRNPKGEIVSEYPAWMHNSAIADLTESIERKKRELKRGMIRSENVHTTKEAIEKESNRLSMILKSKPKLTGKQKDRIAKLYRCVALGISESHFARSDMQRGLIAPSQEADRMVSHHITIDSEFDDIVEACNVRLKNQKATRNQASKILKICGSLLDEPTNAEYYRKDKRTDTYRFTEQVA